MIAKLERSDKKMFIDDIEMNENVIYCLTDNEMAKINLIWEIKNDFLYGRYAKFVSITDPELLKASSSIFEDKMKYYPNFNSWYESKLCNENYRTHTLYFMLDELNIINGVLILKDTSKEKKICTLYTLPGFRKRGAASIMLRFAFRRLRTTKPLFTIPSPLIDDYDRLVTKAKFKLKAIYCDYYKEGLEEYCFNGYLL